MNIEIERKGFEAKYPVPRCAEWHAESGRYISRTPYLNDIRMAAFYNDLLQVWLARAEVEAGEVSAKEESEDQNVK